MSEQRTGEACPHCDGSGWRTEESLTGEGSSYECPKCKGTGKVQRSSEACPHHWVWRIGSLKGTCVDCEAQVLEPVEQPQRPNEASPLDRAYLDGYEAGRDGDYAPSESLRKWHKDHDPVAAFDAWWASRSSTAREAAMCIVEEREASSFGGVEIEGEHSQQLCIMVSKAQWQRFQSWERERPCPEPARLTPEDWKDIANGRDEDVELDSPNFVPKQLEELKARNYQRVNDPRRESASLPVNHPVSVLLVSFAGFIAKHMPPEKHCDHACAECVPGGEIVREGFQCIPHKALAMVRGATQQTSPAKDGGNG